MTSEATSDSEPVETGNESGSEPNSNESSSNANTIWMRLLFMVLFIFLYAVTRFVIGAVVLVQFFWALLTSQPNDALGRLGLSLATYTFQVVRFLTFASEERPYPVDSKWPSGDPAQPSA